jgi:hypothetical protein
MADLTHDEGDMPPQLASACDRFDAAFAEWLAARADSAADHDEDSQEADRARYDRERAAELALISTPAPNSDAVWKKWQLLELAMTHEADTGPFVYPLPILALAALKADILALGLKPWPDA